MFTDDPFDGLVMLSDGGVKSRFTVMLVEDELVAVSVAVPVTTWLAPAVLTVTGEEQLEIGAPPGIQVKDTVTAELFQPLAFGGGTGVAVIPGLALSANFVTKAFCPPANVAW